MPNRSKYVAWYISKEVEPETHWKVLWAESGDEAVELALHFLNEENFFLLSVVDAQGNSYLKSEEIQDEQATKL